MRANHERVKAVLARMKEDAVKASSFNSYSKYSFDAFCKENNIFDDRTTRKGDDIIISCPFHSDSTPSCRLNESKWVYNCFGCKGGNWVDFVFRYHTEILGEEVTWYQFVNNMLREDIALRNMVGFESIYEKDSISFDEIGKFEKCQFKGIQRIPTSYLELLEKFNKINPTLEQQKFFILLMQTGVPVKYAYNTLFSSGQEKVSQKEYDIEKMHLF